MRRGLVATLLLTLALTALAAWPVLRAPREQIYGHEIVGRHADAYTVIAQMAGTGTSGAYAQPLTDDLGWLLARVLSPIAAYNLVVLLSFPLTAVATCVLAFRITRSPTASVIAAIVFTFAPLRLAHAAYHPHIVQTQWLVVYVLALLIFVERPSIARTAGVAIAAAALVSSNAYGGLIGAIMTPVILVAFWFAQPHGERQSGRVIRATGVLVSLAVVGVGFAAWQQPQLFAAHSPFAFPAQDVARYSASWWAYFVPPVDHPWFGGGAAQTFASAGQSVALVEEQVYVSQALLLLAVGATVAAILRCKTDAGSRLVLALATVGVAAWVVSLGPASGSCDGSLAPACLVHRVAPMFRAYARFAFVTHLAIAIVGGFGAVQLARSSALGNAISIMLLAIVAVEYTPLPARAHDVLPTAGHRWLAQQRGVTGVFDCAPVDTSLLTLSSLMPAPVTFANASLSCADPDAMLRLAAMKQSHVIVRPAAPPAAPALLAAHARLVASFSDALVYALPASAPVLTLSTSGFSPWEHDSDRWWRWMSGSGQFAIQQWSTAPRTVAMRIRIVSLHEPRTLTLTIDGAPAGQISVGVTEQESIAGPWTLAPGEHVIAVQASGSPVPVADESHPDDGRALTTMWRSVQWID